MSKKSLWSRLKNAHLVRVIATYLAASWILLQVTLTLRDALELPSWIAPLTIILLAVGLLIVLATAWIQSHPLMPRRESSDEVPGDWELDLLEIKQAVTSGRLPHLNWARVLLAGVVVFSLLFVGAGLYVVVREDRSRIAPVEATTEAAPGVAVLPFDVSGPALTHWREGMVTLLSTGLDGAGDLRAIDSRTLLARWDRQIPNGQRADLAAALDVARSTGARYAVLGSAVAAGTELRLVANVHRVGDEALLGTAQVQGAPDSVMGLVDELVRETLGVLFEEEEMPAVGFEKATTSSLPALKAYLKGEQAYRLGEIEPAIEAFERAVAADSTFALAWRRLATAHGWLEGPTPRVAGIREKARKMAEQLPERERLLQRAEYYLLTGGNEGLGIAREAVRRYPDDPDAWFLLGEYRFHRASAVATFDEAETAFLQSVELNPFFAPYRFHLTELAFMNPPDSILAQRRVKELGQLSSNTMRTTAGKRALALAFGDDSTRAALIDSLPSLQLGDLRILIQHLVHPRFASVQLQVVDELGRRGDPQGFALQFGFQSHLYDRGDLQGALKALDHPGPAWLPSCLLVYALALGVPIPEEVLEERLVPEPDDPAPPPCAEIYLIDKRGVSDGPELIRAVRERALSSYASGDSVGGRILTDYARAVEGYLRWKTGDPAGALPLLEEGYINSGAIVMWMGRIHLELGDPERAARHFASLDLNPIAQYHAGAAWEQAGELRKAAEAYRWLATYWTDPHPALRPLATEARQGLIRTQGLLGE